MVRLIQHEQRVVTLKADATQRLVRLDACFDAGCAGANHATCRATPLVQPRPPVEVRARWRPLRYVFPRPVASASTAPPWSPNNASSRDAASTWCGARRIAPCCTSIVGADRYACAIRRMTSAGSAGISDAHPLDQWCDSSRTQTERVEHCFHQLRAAGRIPPQARAPSGASTSRARAQSSGTGSRAIVHAK